LKTPGTGDMRMNSNGIDYMYNANTVKTAEIFRFSVFFILSLLSSNISAASDYETISYMPSEGIEEFILTCLSDDSDLIAIAYGPSGYHYSEGDPEMSEELVIPWSEQRRPEIDQ
jgi:hypothetical protein